MSKTIVIGANGKKYVYDYGYSKNISQKEKSLLCKIVLNYISKNKITMADEMQLLTLCFKLKSKKSNGETGTDKEDNRPDEAKS